MARFLDYNAQTGISTFHEKDTEGKNIVRSVQDVEPFLKDNARVVSAQESGWKGDLHEVASIPPIVWEMWWKELGDDPGAKRNRPWLVAKLNSNEFQKLRTKEGRM